MAAWPDEPTRQELAALGLEQRKNLRLVGPTRWHVTLRFLGEVAEDRLDALGAALQAALTGFPGPVECRLGPATAWFSQVRVLQLPAHGLGALATQVQEATAGMVPPRRMANPPSTAT